MLSHSLACISIRLNQSHSNYFCYTAHTSSGFLLNVPSSIGMWSRCGSTAQWASHGPQPWAMSKQRSSPCILSSAESLIQVWPFPSEASESSGSNLTRSNHCNSRSGFGPLPSNPVVGPTYKRGMPPLSKNQWQVRPYPPRTLSRGKSSLKKLSCSSIFCPGFLSQSLPLQLLVMLGANETPSIFP